MHQMDPAGVRKWITRGVRLASLGSDGGTFLTAAIAGLKAVKEGTEACGEHTLKTPYDA